MADSTIDGQKNDTKISQHTTVSSYFFLATRVAYGDLVLGVVGGTRCRPRRVDLTVGPLDVLVVSPAIDDLRDRLVMPVRRDVAIDIGFKRQPRVVDASLPRCEGVLYPDHAEWLEAVGGDMNGTHCSRSECEGTTHW